MQIKVIIEKGENELWGRIENGEFLPVTQGQTVAEVLDNLKNLIADYLAHEGQEDNFWQKVTPSKLDFAIHYDLQGFFSELGFLNLSVIATLSGMNQSLLRQYAKGLKYPSQAQAEKIEKTVRQLARRMENFSLLTA